MTPHWPPKLPELCNLCLHPTFGEKFIIDF